MINNSAKFAITLIVSSLTSISAQAYSEPYCREYNETFQVGGQTQSGYGTACLQPDGSWQKQESANFDAGYEQQKQNVVYVIDRQPVQIYQPNYRPYFAPAYPSYRRPYAYAEPSNFFSLSFGDHGYRPYPPHGRGFGHYRKARYHDNSWHGERGRGRGHY